MAIVIRIVSADGKKTIMKTLPGLPSRLKIPAGAKVEVTDEGETKSLSQYVNEQAGRARGGDDNHNGTKIVVETADSWEAAESWLDSMASAPPPKESPDDWFAPAGKGEAEVAGIEIDGLLIGGALAAGAGFGVYELTRGKNGPKDTVAPAAPTGLDLAADDDSGLLNTDNITNKTTGLTLSGTAEAGSIVEIFDGATSLGTVQADSKGVFAKELDLAAGEHSITAKAKDNAGNVGLASTAVKIVVDTTAPAAPTALDLATEDDNGTSSTDNITGKTSGLTITGAAEVGARVELFDGATSLGTATAGANGSFTRDISLSVGNHAITAKVTDAAGNVSPVSETLTIVVDPTAGFTLDLATDDDTGLSSTDNITSKSSGLTISSTITGNTTVELFDGTTSLGTATSGSDGRFTKDISLAEGVHSISAKTTTGGVATSEILTITIDTTAPSAPTTLDLANEDDDGASNSDNITSKTSGLTITGTAIEGSSVELFDGATSLGKVTAGVNGGFTLDTNLGVGTHTITARTTDIAGNAGPSSTALEITVTSAAQASSLAADSFSTLSTDLDHLGLSDSSSSFG